MLETDRDYPEIYKKYVSKLSQDVEMRIMCLSIYTI